jgi:hypothetical protein
VAALAAQLSGSDFLTDGGGKVGTDERQTRILFSTAGHHVFFSYARLLRC